MPNLGSIISGINGRKSREESENEANQGIIEDHNVRGKYKGDGNRIERGISGLEGELSRRKGKNNLGAIQGVIITGPVTRSNQTYRHGGIELGGGRRNGAEGNQQLDNSMEGWMIDMVRWR